MSPEENLRANMHACHMDEDIKAVDMMAHEMLKKLYENRRKHHWRDYSLKWLLNRLRQETGELTRAAGGDKTENIVREAADVANFAMMIADNARREDSSGG